jgi:MOSC domain-containing protein YiiM
VLGLAVGPEGAETPLYREPREAVLLVEGKGIEGDKKFGKSKTRHVNLVSRHSYDWFKQSFGRDRYMPGGFGEQMVISEDIDPNWLKIGQRIRVGEAILQVVTPRTPCEGFTQAVEGAAVSHFVGHVGVMCAVVRGGRARIGDAVSLIDE